MKRIFTFFTALFFFAVMFGQTQLPNDPAVRKGKLENGMTYYIRHNDKPANRAEFYLATNVGAIQETPDQDGLAHFLEHMCFNGTKNLPGKTMLDYLQSIGAEFGGNINAATGVEQTTYMLNNIPIVREGIIDTCLLIMHDYSHYVTNSPEEIDKERGVIIEERRTRRTADWRMHEKSLPYMYGDSKYATCTLIGSQENLETFKPESLVSFYQTWYRPDLQAVIVVGDIDVDQIEAKIKKLFSDIPAHINPKAKDVHKLPVNEEPVIGIITDPEASRESLEIFWKGEPMPEELNSTDVGMMNTIIKYYISIIMSERFDDLSAKADTPFLNAGMGIGALCETSEAVFGRITSKAGQTLPSFRLFMTEVEKMSRYGFTESEVSRAGENILRMFEKAAESASSRENADFVDLYINNFFDNYPYMEPEKEYELAKMMCSQINSALLNQIVKSLIPENNLVIVYKGPQKEGLTQPTEADFLNIMKEVKESEIEQNAEESVNEPLLDPESVKGSSVKKEKKVIYGATEWTLKNGLKVVVLPTEHKKDQVLFDLYMDGGRSVIATEDLPSFDDNIFGLFLNNSGIAGFPKTKLNKMLAGKDVNVNPYIGSYKHGIYGSASPKDLETAFQLMYLRFTAPRFDEGEFNLGIEHLRTILPNLAKQPNFIFSSEITKFLYGNNPRRFFLSEEVLEKANIATVEKEYRKLFNNIAGATLVITGNVDLNTLKPMVEKYAGALPKGKKAHQWKDNEEYYITGEQKDHKSIEMETPKNSVLQVYYTTDVKYSVKESVMLDAAKYVLDMIYTASLREDEGGTYGAGVAVNMTDQPRDLAVLQVIFDTNPESVMKLCGLAKEGIEKLAKEGPTQEELTRTVENFKKNIPESRISNSYWMNNLKFYYKHNGADYNKLYEEAVSEISAENIRKAAENIISSGNFIEIMVGPETK